MIDNSPRTIAAFHVLHRRNVPRHPPCAPTTNNNKKATLHPTTHTKHCMHNGARINQTKYKKKRLLASTIQFSHNTPTPHEATNKQQPHMVRPGTTTMCHPRHPTMHQRTPTLRVSHTPPTTRYRYPMIMMPHTNNRVPKQAIHPQKQTISAHQPPAGPLRQQKVKLLRKEVIQPHLPVRLPCYDFVPIANPTFDGSLTSLGHRLRVLPTFMT